MEYGRCIPNIFISSEYARISSMLVAYCRLLYIWNNDQNKEENSTYMKEDIIYSLYVYEQKDQDKMVRIQDKVDQF